jgi:hypothetical protein
MLAGTFVDEAAVIIVVLALVFGLSMGQLLTIIGIALRLAAVAAALWLTYSLFALGASGDDDEEGWWERVRGRRSEQGGVRHVN